MWTTLPFLAPTQKYTEMQFSSQATLDNWKLKLAIVFVECRCPEGVSSIPHGWVSQTAGSYVGVARCNDAHTHACARTHAHTRARARTHTHTQSNKTFTHTQLTLNCCIIRLLAPDESWAKWLCCTDFVPRWGLDVSVGRYSCWHVIRSLTGCHWFTAPQGC